MARPRRLAWYWLLLLHMAMIAAMGGVLLLWRCPLRLLFGIACPGCGLTRACMALLRLDFSAAFAAYPLWFVALPLLWTAVHYPWLSRRLCRRTQKIVIAAMLVAAAALVLVYVLRWTLWQDPVVVPDAPSGLVYGRLHPVT